MSQLDPDPQPASKKAVAAGGAEAAQRRAWCKALVASLLVVLVTVGILRAMGRTWWCKCATPHLFVADVWSEHNSQHVLDPYVFSHIQHGLVLYGLLVLVASWWSPGIRVVTAITIECGWEVVENTSWIIDKYRESTVSLEYYGDSIVNSVADIGACALGYAIAATVPVIVSAVGFLTIELVMLLLIRDSFLLNVVMLVYPLEAIKQWQLGGAALLSSCKTWHSSVDSTPTQTTKERQNRRVVQRQTLRRDKIGRGVCQGKVRNANSESAGDCIEAHIPHLGVCAERIFTRRHRFGTRSFFTASSRRVRLHS